jgi:4-hydroxyacetophenone monooxygenase
MGEPIPAQYASIIGAELAAVRDEPAEKVALPKDFKVIIIGAGVSGLCAAMNLQQAGIPFTILEKSKRLGGIWRDNRYPGAGVDTPNHLYSFANAPYDWSMYYALRDELHAYLEHVADEFSLRQHIRFEQRWSRRTMTAPPSNGGSLSIEPMVPANP